jgi:amino acid transporter
MTFGTVLVFLLAALGIWYLLDRREKARLAKGLSRHSGLRLIFASFAILTVLFSGGCGGLFLFSWIADGMRSNNYIGWEIIAVLSLPPLLIGLVVWWLAMRRKSEINKA